MTSAAARPETAGTPTASYRLQLQPEFTLRDARRAVPYLAALGVSHLHLSPLLEAVAGSTHGYDTLDHSRISEQLGGEGALRELAAEAAAHGLALIADVVPNHMALPVPERLNGPLWQVLKNGPDDPFATWFDIDWQAQPGPVDAPERGRLLLPLLGDRLGAVLEQLVVDGEVLRYHEHEFPLRPGTEGLPLAELLERQWYRLCWWQLADEQVNYRRFFTVNDLIAVRVEVPEVFEATHGVLLRLHREGVLAGFRIDHPDGLADPRGYLRRLAEATGGAYTVVEKILTGDEALPADWPCAGTTGYDALRRIDGVLTDRRGAEKLFAAYRRDAGDAAGPAEAGRAGRAEMVAPGGALSAETGRLVRLVGRICAEGPELADHSPLAVRRALEDLLTGYPVYRPYVVPGEPAPLEARQALAAPAGASDTELLVRALALGSLGRSAAKDEFCRRFGQTASAVAAKGVEDTAFYRFNALLSLNEVGGLPERPGVPVAEFHRWCAEQERLWPGAMTALSTHDTKRSADARARLAVLAELPEVWAAECAAWTLAAGPCADRSTAWLLWQTLLAAWPLPQERLLGVVLKSVREAKRRTSWKEPDAGFEGWLTRYVRGALANPGLCPRIAGFAGLVAPFARVNSLSAALLHLLAPGVPDVFQGGEEPLYTLVDPDNRAPVDLGALAVRLTDSPEPRPGDLAREKLHLTTTALHLRRAGALGSYRPLAADGPAAEHLVAFGRGERVLCAATRLPYGLHRAGGWRETVLELPPGRWTDLLTERHFTGGPVELSYLFRQLPVALLSEGS
ncbi:malto-oligosyltrehalose synthase [Kitasatospora sp. NPDC057198]|uniref:malto-oligosyltrehalose synthase n=1 Tax=Kitasatospora sp. NPDC057198 TaxID=3346046 RepID=UPI00363B8CBC